MSAFREQDEKFFFGRQKFVDSLVEVVYRQPLVAVIGASGSGKSSVVFAGLIPKLRQKGNLLIESFRPQNQPFFGLASALVRLLKPELDEIQQPGRAAELVTDLKRELTLPQVVTSILVRYPGKRLLLVIDQFEELYNPRNDTEQLPFVDALLAAIQSAPNDLTVVLTLRADFLSYLLNYPTFGAALQQHKPQLLGAMNREEMREAIECPAEEIGVKLEEGLTERILDAVKREPGNLPLLEFALEQLWGKQKNNRLTHDAYDDIKGVEKALAVYAQSVYEELTQKIDGKQIQQIFIQLVRVGEGTDDTRQQATRAEVGDDNWDLVKQLADKRLVVTGRNEATGEETVEVVHEALIREWGLLRQLIIDNQKKLIQKREIEDAAKRWRDKERVKDYLLGGKVLTEAKVFEKQEGGNLRLSDLAKEFIDKSLRQRRNNRIKFFGVGFGLGWIFVPALLLFLGFFTMREIEKYGLLATLREHQEQKDSPGRIQALERLVKLGVNLDKTKLKGAYLRGADLSSAYLRDADLRSAYLYSANLRGANLSGADLGGAELSSTNLGGADLSIANLSDTNLSSADLGSANLYSANLRGANLRDANLRDAKLNDADLTNSIYDKETKFPKDFAPSGKNMYLIGPDADLSNADLKRADLSSADLKRADLSNADLKRADLSSADLSSADLSSADLSGADLKCLDSDIRYGCTNFRGAKNLTAEQVKSAKNWQQAEYDEEFRKKLGLK
ncbi:pentapeptide repeat-containing protein [Aerosakkonemataceae cyanobacterium BLCC-F50]|uniref:Pentapeptide repeat-containing protein n=1 Tax=Floridaenema flaviceps BLCC-F50 TaxID=3153642 RepID=A0ABV4XXZ5_9CYAN